MEKFGEELIFISQINRDGSGVTKWPEEAYEIYKKDKFQINHLSLSNKTYIASGFNSFVVKLK